VKVHAEFFAAALSKRAIMEAWEGCKGGDLRGRGFVSSLSLFFFKNKRSNFMPQSLSLCLAAVIVACILCQGAAFSGMLSVTPGPRAIGRPASRPARRNSLSSWSPRTSSAHPHADLCMVQPGLYEVKSLEMQLEYLGDARCLPRRHFLPSVPGLKYCVHTRC